MPDAAPPPSTSGAACRIGIDTGGTFTDFVVRDAARVRVHKVLSTPDDPARAVLAGLAELFPDGWDGEITYGSTVATNALLERRGARVCLVTTAGFEDVLEIGRQARPDLYALEPRVPPPLVGRADRLGVRERVDLRRPRPDAAHAPRARASAGACPRAAARGDRGRAAARLRAAAARARASAERSRALGVPITLSHALVREHREYERTSTTVVNAYVAPVMSRHLRTPRRAGIPRGRLRVMQSNGGAVAPALAAREPVRTILSGPAGGVVGAARARRRASACDAILTLDMGGTSTDVALVDGAVPRRSDWTLDRMALRVPVIDIHTVGAGGGSIARRDAGGSLQVGSRERRRRSRAGVLRARHRGDRDRREPRARPARRRRISSAAAWRSIARAPRRAVASAGAPARLSRRRGPPRASCEVVNAAMARALRVISVERGHDPRDFTLVAFGGAGGAARVRARGRARHAAACWSRAIPACSRRPAWPPRRARATT